MDDKKAPGSDYAVTYRMIGPFFSGTWSNQPVEPPPMTDHRQWFLCNTNAVARTEGGVALIFTWQRFE